MASDQNQRRREGRQQDAYLIEQQLKERKFDYITSSDRQHIAKELEIEQKEITQRNIVLSVLTQAMMDACQDWLPDEYSASAAGYVHGLRSAIICEISDQKGQVPLGALKLSGNFRRIKISPLMMDQLKRTYKEFLARGIRLDKLLSSPTKNWKEYGLDEQHKWREPNSKIRFVPSHPGTIASAVPCAPIACALPNQDLDKRECFNDLYVRTGTAAWSQAWFVRFIYNSPTPNLVDMATALQIINIEHHAYDRINGNNRPLFSDQKIPDAILSCLTAINREVTIRGTDRPITTKRYRKTARKTRAKKTKKSVQLSLLLEEKTSTGKTKYIRQIKCFDSQITDLSQATGEGFQVPLNTITTGDTSCYNQEQSACNGLDNAVKAPKQTRKRKRKTPAALGVVTRKRANEQLQNSPEARTAPLLATAGSSNAKYEKSDSQPSEQGVLDPNTLQKEIQNLLEEAYLAQFNQAPTGGCSCQVQGHLADQFQAQLTAGLINFNDMGQATNVMHDLLSNCADCFHRTLRSAIKQNHDIHNHDVMDSTKQGIPCLTNNDTQGRDTQQGTSCSTSQNVSSQTQDCSLPRQKSANQASKSIATQTVNELQPIWVCEKQTKYEQVAIQSDFPSQVGRNLGQPAAYPANAPNNCRCHLENPVEQTQAQTSDKSASDYYGTPDPQQVQSGHMSSSAGSGQTMASYPPEVHIKDYQEDGLLQNEMLEYDPFTSLLGAPLGSEHILYNTSTPFPLAADTKLSVSCTRNPHADMLPLSHSQPRQNPDAPGGPYPAVTMAEYAMSSVGYQPMEGAGMSLDLDRKDSAFAPPAATSQPPGFTEYWAADTCLETQSLSPRFMSTGMVPLDTIAQS